MISVVWRICLYSILHYPGFQRLFSRYEKSESRSGGFSRCFATRSFVALFIARKEPLESRIPEILHSLLVTIKKKTILVSQKLFERKLVAHFLLDNSSKGFFSKGFDAEQ